MASLNRMVKAVSGLHDTDDLSEWENEFVGSIVEKTRDGEDTRSLTERQITVLERLFAKHFAA